MLHLLHRTFPFITMAFADAGYAGDHLATATIINTSLNTYETGSK